MDTCFESGLPRFTQHTQNLHTAMEQEPAEETETQGGWIMDRLFLYVHTVETHNPNCIAFNVLHNCVNRDGLTLISVEVFLMHIACKPKFNKSQCVITLLYGNISNEKHLSQNVS